MPEVVEVAIDRQAPLPPLLLRVEVAPGATVGEALELARELAALPAGEVDWASAPCGVWGERCGRGQALRAGDRVELYQPLASDPRARRRQRVRRARGRPRNGPAGPGSGA